MLKDHHRDLQNGSFLVETDMARPEEMSSSELEHELKRMVKDVHRGFLLCELVVALTSARGNLERTSNIVNQEATSKKIPFSQCESSPQNQYFARRVFALESLIDFCLTTSRGPFLCDKAYVEKLIEYAGQYNHTLQTESRVSVPQVLGELRKPFENTIPHQILSGNTVVPKEPKEVKKAFKLVYDEKKKYLAKVFPEHLGFSWEGFVESVTVLVADFFYGPGYLSRASLCQARTHIPEFDAVLRQLEYLPSRAKERFALGAKKRYAMQGRLLFWHPIVSDCDKLIVSGRLLLDSFIRYAYRYSKESHLFRTEKGHLFETQIAETLEKHTWKVVETNFLVKEMIVPGKTKAEYDIIAGKGRYLLIIEAKAYTPELGSPGYTKSKRLKLAQGFAKKLRLKAEFIANNFFSLPLEQDAYKEVIPILLTTSPLAPSSTLEGVLVLVQPDLSTVLSAPDKVDKSAVISIRTE